MLIITIEKESIETLSMEEITRKGKNIVRIILVKYLIKMELSGSLLK